MVQHLEFAIIQIKKYVGEHAFSDGMRWNGFYVLERTRGRGGGPYPSPLAAVRRANCYTANDFIITNAVRTPHIIKATK